MSPDLCILKTISLGQRALHRVGMVTTFVFSNGEKQLCCCKAEFMFWNCI